MTLGSAESCGKESLNQFPGKGLADHEATKTDQIEIVVLNPLVRRKCLVNQTRTDAGNFVGHDRCSNSAAANGHAPRHLPSGHGASQRDYIVRIIIVELQAPVSEIDCFVTSRPQPPGQISLQRKAAVVGGNAHELRSACGKIG